MNRKLMAIPLLILVLGLITAGCLVETGAQVGKQAPDFQLQNLNGETVSLKGLRGSPVMLNFWASWCGPCRYEMPFIQEIYDDEGWQATGLVILAIDIKESASLVEQFMQSNNLSFTALLDTSGEVSLEYNVSNIPTTFLIDKDGIIQVKKVGAFLDKADIERSLENIIP